MQNKDRIITWVKEHKKEIIITSGIAVALVIGTIIIKNHKASKALEPIKEIVHPKDVQNAIVNPENVDSVKKIVEKSSFPVKQHIRNLPYGWHASESKIKEAAQLGIPLSEGQTFVRDYKKCA